MDNILDSINLSAPKGNFISIVLEDFYDDIITSVNEDLSMYASSDVICDNDEEYLVDCFVEVCMDNPNDMEKKILAEMVYDNEDDDLDLYEYYDDEDEDLIAALDAEIAEDEGDIIEERTNILSTLKGAKVIN
jgi:hypothetical protein